MMVNPNSNIQDQQVPVPQIQNPQSGVALREEFVGAKIRTIQGEVPSVTKVNYFKGKDPSKWKTNISTYEMVSLGEVYEGIELKLKAYGNNVEKLFCVKPGAYPGQIRIALSGIQPQQPTDNDSDRVSNPVRANLNGKQPPESPFIKGDLTESPLEKGARGLSVNEHGELEVAMELGPVKFTKPVAYQEIDGKRVYVDAEYFIEKSEVRRQRQEAKAARGKRLISSREKGMGRKGAYLTFNSQLSTKNVQPETQNASPATRHSSHSVYSFKVASYDTTKDLIIDPLLASTYLGGTHSENGYSITLDTSGNVYVTGYTKSSDFPTTDGAYDIYGYAGSNYDVFVSKLGRGIHRVTS